MSLGDILAEVRGYAAANRIVISPHARARMSTRGVTYRDLRHALQNATGCTADATPGRWRVVGQDLDEEGLTVVVVIEDGLIVVTVF